MKSNTRFTMILTTFIFCAALLIGVSSHASPWPPQRLEAISKKLELDESQREQLKQIGRILAKGHGQSGDAAQHRTELSELVMQPQLDQAQLQTLLDQQQLQRETKRKEVMAEVMPLLAELHASLSTQQKEALVAMLAKGPERRRHGSDRKSSPMSHRP